MIYSSCLHDQQDLCWGNTSRDTSEELQVLHGQLYLHLPTFFVLALKTMLSWFCVQLKIQKLTCAMCMGYSSHRNPCICKFSWKFWNQPCICKVAGLLTLAFARFDVNDTIVNFSFELCEFWLQSVQNKTKNRNCIGKTKCNLASTKTRKWVIVILHLPLQRSLMLTTKKLNWSIPMVLQKIKWTFVWAWSC